ncbi:hypothetical protein ACIQVK_48120, partial [Streptomyces sp. NPDC090493]
MNGGGLGRVVAGDGESGGALGRAVVRDGEDGGGLGRVVMGDGESGGALGLVVVRDGEGELGWCGVTDGLGVGVRGGAGFVVGVCTGGGGTGCVRWGAGRVAVGTGGAVRVGLGAGVWVGFGVFGAAELGADDRGEADGDGLGVDAVGVTTGDDVAWGVLPPWSDDSSAQAARPPPRATTAAPPAIHGALRAGRRCRFMILTVHPNADGLKPGPSRRPPPATVRRSRAPGPGHRASTGVRQPVRRRTHGPPTKADRARNRLKRGSRGGRPPTFDKDDYKQRHAVEMSKPQSCHSCGSSSSLWAPVSFWIIAIRWW